MNTTKIEALKQAAEETFAAHESKKAELAAQGLNAKAREKALKALKAAYQEAHAEYAAFAKGQIRGELNKIIRDAAPARAEAARARSPWKQAKFDAANGRA